MRVLLSGSSGLLGPYLRDALGELGDVVTIGRSAADLRCDLTDGPAVRDALQQAPSDVVVHAAALTDVDRCEREPDVAEAINAQACANLQAAMPASTLFVAFSTDNVYGDAPGPHAEGSAAPVNAYGRSKLRGEAAVRRQAHHLVLRTNLFGPSRTPGRTSFSDFVASNLAAGESVTLFVDVRYSPLHLHTVSRYTVAAINAGLRGTYNLGGREGVSKFDLGMLIAEQLGLPTATVTAGRSATVEGRAPRPLDARMDVTKFEKAMRTRLPTVTDEVASL